MRIGNLDIVAPGLVDEPRNEAETFGSGPAVKDFAGIAVMPQEARAWFETHPVASAQE